MKKTISVGLMLLFLAGKAAGDMNEKRGALFMTSLLCAAGGVTAMHKADANRERGRLASQWAAGAFSHTTGPDVAEWQAFGARLQAGADRNARKAIKQRRLAAVCFIVAAVPLTGLVLTYDNHVVGVKKVWKF